MGFIDETLSANHARFEGMIFSFVKMYGQTYNTSQDQASGEKSRHFAHRQCVRLHDYLVRRMLADCDNDLDKMYAMSSDSKSFSDKICSYMDECKESFMYRHPTLAESKEPGFDTEDLRVVRYSVAHRQAVSDELDKASQFINANSRDFGFVSPYDTSVFNGSVRASRSDKNAGDMIAFVKKDVIRGNFETSFYHSQFPGVVPAEDKRVSAVDSVGAVISGFSNISGYIEPKDRGPVRDRLTTAYSTRYENIYKEANARKGNLANGNRNVAKRSRGNVYPFAETTVAMEYSLDKTVREIMFDDSYASFRVADRDGKQYLSKPVSEALKSYAMAFMRGKDDAGNLYTDAVRDKYSGDAQLIHAFDNIDKHFEDRYCGDEFIRRELTFMDQQKQTMLRLLRVAENTGRSFHVQVSDNNKTCLADIVFEDGERESIRVLDVFNPSLVGRIYEKGSWVYNSDTQHVGFAYGIHKEERASNIGIDYAIDNISPEATIALVQYRLGGHVGKVRLDDTFDGPSYVTNINDLYRADDERLSSADNIGVADSNSKGTLETGRYGVVFPQKATHLKAEGATQKAQTEDAQASKGFLVTQVMSSSRPQLRYSTSAENRDYMVNTAGFYLGQYDPVTPSERPVRVVAAEYIPESINQQERLLEDGKTGALLGYTNIKSGVIPRLPAATVYKMVTPPAGTKRDDVLNMTNQELNIKDTFDEDIVNGFIDAKDSDTGESYIISEMKRLAANKPMSSVSAVSGKKERKTNRDGVDVVAYKVEPLLIWKLVDSTTGNIVIRHEPDGDTSGLSADIYNKLSSFLTKNPEVLEAMKQSPLFKDMVIDLDASSFSVPGGAKVTIDPPFILRPIGSMRNNEAHWEQTKARNDYLNALLACQAIKDNIDSAKSAYDDMIDLDAIEEAAKNIMQECYDENGTFDQARYNELLPTFSQDRTIRGIQERYLSILTFRSNTLSYEMNMTSNIAADDDSEDLSGDEASDVNDFGDEANGADLREEDDRVVNSNKVIDLKDADFAKRLAEIKAHKSELLDVTFGDVSFSGDQLVVNNGHTIPIGNVGTYTQLGQQNRSNDMFKYLFNAAHGHIDVNALNMADYSARVLISPSMVRFEDAPVQSLDTGDGNAKTVFTYADLVKAGLIDESKNQPVSRHDIAHSTYLFALASTACALRDSGASETSKGNDDWKTNIKVSINEDGMISAEMPVQKRFSSVGNVDLDDLHRFYSGDIKLTEKDLYRSTLKMAFGPVVEPDENGVLIRKLPDGSEKCVVPGYEMNLKAGSGAIIDRLQFRGYEQILSEEITKTVRSEMFSQNRIGLPKANALANVFKRISDMSIDLNLYRYRMSTIQKEGESEYDYRERMDKIRHEHGHTDETLSLDDFIEQCKYDVEVEMSVLQTLKGRCRMSRDFAEKAGTQADAMNDCPWEPDAWRYDYTLSDRNNNENVRVLTKSYDGLTDPTLTGQASIQGIVKFLVDGAEIDSEGRPYLGHVIKVPVIRSEQEHMRELLVDSGIMVADEWAEAVENGYLQHDVVMRMARNKNMPEELVPRTAFANNPIMDFAACDPCDRNQMASSQSYTALGWEHNVGVAFMTVEGLTNEDGIVISRRMAERRRIKSAHGGERGLMRQDKLSDMHGNKGVISDAMDPRMCSDNLMKSIEESAEYDGILVDGIPMDEFLASHTVDEILDAKFLDIHITAKNYYYDADFGVEKDYHINLNDLKEKTGLDLLSYATVVGQEGQYAFTPCQMYDFIVQSIWAEEEINGKYDNVMKLFALNEKNGLDMIVSPYSFASRGNAGTMREASVNSGSIIMPNGAVVDGLMGHLNMIVVDMPADVKTHFYTESSFMDKSKGRKASAQLAWVLVGNKMDAVMHEIYGHNDDAVAHIREYYLALGMDLTSDLEPVLGYAGGQWGEQRTTLPSAEDYFKSHGIEYDAESKNAKKQLQRMISMATASKPGRVEDLRTFVNDYTGMMERMGGFFKLPFQLDFHTMDMAGVSPTNSKGEPNPDYMENWLTPVEDADKTRYLLPLLSNSMRKGMKVSGEQAMAHDYTTHYQNLIMYGAQYELFERLWAMSDASKTNAERAQEVEDIIFDAMLPKDTDLKSANGEKQYTKVSAIRRFREMWFDRTKKIEDAEPGENLVIAAQKVFDDMKNDIATKHISSKHNVFRDELMSTTTKTSATALWSADPTLKANQIAMSLEHAKMLGLTVPSVDMTAYAVCGDMSQYLGANGRILQARMPEEISVRHAIHTGGAMYEYQTFTISKSEVLAAVNLISEFRKKSDKSAKLDFTANGNAVSAEAVIAAMGILSRAEAFYMDETVFDHMLKDVNSYLQANGYEELAEKPVLRKGNDGRILVWRDPVLHKSCVSYLEPVIDNNVHGVRINPAIAAQFEGDFDGDTVALVRLSDKAAQDEAFRVLAPETNALCFGDQAEYEPAVVSAKHLMALASRDDVTDIMWQQAIVDANRLAELYSDVTVPDGFADIMDAKERLSAVNALITDFLAKHEDELNFAGDRSLYLSDGTDITSCDVYNKNVFRAFFTVTEDGKYEPRPIGQIQRYLQDVLHANSPCTNSTCVSTLSTTLLDFGFDLVGMGDFFRDDWVEYQNALNDVETDELFHPVAAGYRFVANGKSISNDRLADFLNTVAEQINDAGGIKHVAELRKEATKAMNELQPVIERYRRKNGIHDAAEDRIIRGEFDRCINALATSQLSGVGTEMIVLQSPKTIAESYLRIVNTKAKGKLPFLQDIVFNHFSGIHAEFEYNEEGKPIAVKDAYYAQVSLDENGNEVVTRTSGFDSHGRALPSRDKETMREAQLDKLKVLAIKSDKTGLAGASAYSLIGLAACTTDFAYQRTTGHTLMEIMAECGCKETQATIDCKHDTEDAVAKNIIMSFMTSRVYQAQKLESKGGWLPQVIIGDAHYPVHLFSIQEPGVFASYNGQIIRYEGDHIVDPKTGKSIPAELYVDDDGKSRLRFTDGAGKQDIAAEFSAGQIGEYYETTDASGKKELHLVTDDMERESDDDCKNRLRNESHQPVVIPAVKERDNYSPEGIMRCTYAEYIEQVSGLMRAENVGFSEDYITMMANSMKSDASIGGISKFGGANPAIQLENKGETYVLGTLDNAKIRGNICYSGAYLPGSEKLKFEVARAKQNTEEFIKSQVSGEDVHMSSLSSMDKESMKAYSETCNKLEKTNRETLKLKSRRDRMTTNISKIETQLSRDAEFKRRAQAGDERARYMTDEVRSEKEKQLATQKEQLEKLNADIKVLDETVFELRCTKANLEEGRTCASMFMSDNARKGVVYDKNTQFETVEKIAKQVSGMSFYEAQSAISQTAVDRAVRRRRNTPSGASVSVNPSSPQIVQFPVKETTEQNVQMETPKTEPVKSQIAGSAPVKGNPFQKADQSQTVVTAEPVQKLSEPVSTPVSKPASPVNLFPTSTPITAHIVKNDAGVCEPFVPEKFPSDIEPSDRRIASLREGWSKDGDRYAVTFEGYSVYGILQTFCALADRCGDRGSVEEILKECPSSPYTGEMGDWIVTVGLNKLKEGLGEKAKTRFDETLYIWANGQKSFQEDPKKAFQYEAAVRTCKLFAGNADDAYKINIPGSNMDSKEWAEHLSKGLGLEQMSTMNMFRASNTFRKGMIGTGSYSKEITSTGWFPNTAYETPSSSFADLMQKLQIQAETDVDGPSDPGDGGNK